MVLQADSNIPMTEERIQHFEHHRVNFVPQYLFRAWSSKSGGGRPTTIKSEAEIIPAAFMHGRKVPDFYTRSEAELYDIVDYHCGGGFFLSEFSSWSASLHLVLVYATSMPVADDPHVAVMDTHQVGRDSGVRVWHTSQLFRFSYPLSPTLKNAEYLAHGQIRGNGYKAVPLQMLKECGMYELVLGLEKYNPISTPHFCEFGYSLRAQTFQIPIQSIADSDILMAKGIATLFGELSAPVAVALLCLRPRPTVESDPDLLSDLRITVLRGLGRTTLRFPPGFELKPWLEADGVDTRGGFHDVKQWIQLFRILATYEFTEVLGERGRKRKLATEDDSSKADAPCQPEKEKRLS
ncbi:hypothetical protein FB567DRAFT_589467 [Paraphoma chrysanthemicola]|uniref:DUF7587 domain-containing protein n=1 Tax=Paraphoma chrysanthemicola TaxID=798071 RepID=A0A8K0REX4_9PLEO|nr:hypothetical protein FB567DRAFT_589467 [Paraphoma chrysanthemicola]